MLELLKSALTYVSASTGEGVLNPIYEGITLIGPYAISLVLVLSIFYGIFLGVKYAKAQDESEKANAQKTLVNFIIGAVVVLVLISVLYAIRAPLAEWINNG